MKQALVFAAMVLSAGAALAHGDGGRSHHGREVTTCADSRLMERFSSRRAAERYCSALDNNYYVSVGVTYDYGYNAYTCSCYSNDNHGGGNN